MGPGAGLGVKLYSKAVSRGVVQPLAAEIIGVDVAEFGNVPDALRHHGVAVVLAGDEAAAGFEVLHRLIGAPVPVLELYGFAPEGQGRELMPEANAEHRQLSHELFELLNLEDVLFRVSRAVGQHESIRPERKHVLGGGIMGQHRHAAAALLQAFDDVVLGAVVQQGNVVLLLPFCRKDVRFFGARLRHAAQHRVTLNGVQIARHLITDECIHNALLPDDAGEGAGIDAADAGDTVLLEKGVQRVLAAEVGRGVAQLAHHVALCKARAFEVLGNDAIVADEGEGLHNDLPGVAGIGQSFEIARHAGGEHQLPQPVTVGADARPLKDAAVIQNQISFFHIFTVSRP